ncbi:pentapeptide repeat-containing protein [Deinococcus rubellus]|uniref:pentapeptide repeat-containing protein n=1 Tax=Deinococcus rubellus TaxID=1889240 RepID=UPI0031EC06CE
MPIPSKPPSKPKFSPGGLQALEPSALENEAIYRGRVLEDDSLAGRRLASVSFEGCVFRHMDLRQVNWHRVRCVDVRFEQCDLTGAALHEASFERVEFIESRLLGMQSPSVRLRHVRLVQVHAPLSMWVQADAKHFWAEECDFEEATFIESHFPGSMWRGCNLTQANFLNALLMDADLRGSTLTNTRLGIRELAGVTVEAVQLLDLAHLLNVRVVELI